MINLASKLWNFIAIYKVPVLPLTLPPRAAKSGHFVILLCITPDDFTCKRRASGWERVNKAIFTFVRLSIDQNESKAQFHLWD